jgi:hypothetical protein
MVSGSAHLDTILWRRGHFKWLQIHPKLRKKNAVCCILRLRRLRFWGFPSLLHHLSPSPSTHLCACSPVRLVGGFLGWYWDLGMETGYNYFQDRCLKVLLLLEPAWARFHSPSLTPFFQALLDMLSSALLLYLSMLLTAGSTWVQFFLSWVQCFTIGRWK